MRWMGEIGFVSGLYRFVDVGYCFLSSSPHSKVNHPNITQLLAVTLTSEPTTLILVSLSLTFTPCFISLLSPSLPLSLSPLPFSPFSSFLSSLIYTC